jgi:DNA repair protein RadC
MHTTRANPLAERISLSGVACLGDVELLALLLHERRGKPRLSDAARLLDEMGGLSQFLDQSVHTLGMALPEQSAAITRVVAAVELGRRALSQRMSERREAIKSSAEVERWARPRLATLDHEEVWVLGLDGKNALKTADRVGQGGAHGCALTPRDILGPALRHAASAIVLVHNHPSGEPEPSAEDIAMTRAVAEASNVVGVPLLDHVVVARGGAASIFELIAE